MRRGAWTNRAIARRLSAGLHVQARHRHRRPAQRPGLRRRLHRRLRRHHADRRPHLLLRQSGLRPPRHHRAPRGHRAELRHLFLHYGLKIGPDLIAAEARRFHLDQPTGIDLPYETRRMLIPDPEWKKAHDGRGLVCRRHRQHGHRPGFHGGHAPARWRAWSPRSPAAKPRPSPRCCTIRTAPPQHTEPIGLAPGQYAAILDGMEGCTTHGTAKIFNATCPTHPRPADRRQDRHRPDRRGTGTPSTSRGSSASRPIDDPQIAVAVAIEGDTPGENFAGGRYAAPVAQAVLKTWFEKSATPCRCPQDAPRRQLTVRPALRLSAAQSAAGPVSNRPARPRNTACGSGQVTRGP